MSKIENSPLRRLSLAATGLALGAAGAISAAGIANAATPDPVPEEATEYGSATVDAEGAAAQPWNTVYPPEGGIWNYGTTGSDGGGIVYSDFFHEARPHGSSVVNAHGDTDRSPVAVAGEWSHASLPAVAGEVDEAFYWFAD